MTEMTVAETKQKKEQMQRSNRVSNIVAASKIISKGELVWTPPKAKDRYGNEIDDDDATQARNERGQKQSLKHSALLNSMDLIVDGSGFLVPRRCKSGSDDNTIDNEMCLYESQSESESDTSSYEDQSSSEEEAMGRNGVSFSSIPYCRLMPDSFDMGSAPQTPSGHKSRNSKSFGTPKTEAMTRTTSDSQSGMFASPRPLSHHGRGVSFQSPREAIPQSFDVSEGHDLVSPLPEPPHSGGNSKNKKRIGLNKRSSKTAQSACKESSSKKDSFYIPGITAPGRSSSKASVDSRASAIVKEPPKSPQKKPVLASPVISNSRVPSPAKKISQFPERSPAQQPQSFLQRNRSESAADPAKSPQKYPSLVRRVSRVQSDSAKQDQRAGENHNYDGSRRSSKQGVNRHFVPGNTEALLIASPNVMYRESSAVSAAALTSPPKTPSSSSRSTSLTTRMTFSNSTGRETLNTFPSLETDMMDYTGTEQVASENSGRRHRDMDLGHHFQYESNSSAKSPFHRSQRRSHQNEGMLKHIQTLTLDEDDNGSLGEEVSEAGAVIIPTRKVSKTPGLRRKSSHRRSCRERNHC